MTPGSDAQRRTKPNAVEVKLVVGKVVDDHVAASLQRHIAGQRLKRLLGDGHIDSRAHAGGDRGQQAVVDGRPAIGNDDVLRIQQHISNVARRSRGVHRAAKDKVALPRSLHLPPIASLRAPACTDRRRRSGEVIAPQHHRAAIAAVRGIGLDRAARFGRGLPGVGDPAVLPLPAATDQGFAAALGSAHIDQGAALELDFVGGGMNLPAQCSVAGLDAAVDLQTVFGFEHDFAAFGADGGGLDQPAVLQGGGKHANGVTFQGAQVDGLVGGGLHLQPDAFQAPAGDVDFLACGQHGGAVGGFQQGLGAGLQVRGDEHDVAAARQDLAIGAELTVAQAVTTKDQPASNGVGFAHAQYRGSKAGGVDHGTRTHGNARGVDQHQAAVGAQGAEDGAGVVAQHAVDGGAVGRGLVELGDAAAGHREALPVEHAVSSASAVLGGDDGFVALGGLAGTAVDGLQAGGLGSRQGGGQEGGGNGQRRPGGPETRHCRCRCRWAERGH
jgi:hypothetical protein